MRILVPVKRVPDPYGRVTVTAAGEVDLLDVKWVINPFDEIALEEAVRLRERGTDTEIIAVTVGKAEAEPILRTALAMGADRAIHVLFEHDSDPQTVARLLHAVADREKPDLILMGKQAIDDDNSQVGPRLAALVNWPQATFASAITLTAGSARVTREVDAGRETVEVNLPAVITADLRLNEPRYVALPAILKARSKPLTTLKPEDLGVAAAPKMKIRIVRQEAPPARRAGRRVGSVNELVEALRDEAGVL